MHQADPDKVIEIIKWLSTSARRGRGGAGDRLSQHISDLLLRER
jgi:hypothetical protein